MTAKKMLQAREPDSAPLERKPNPPRRILVVDDEPYIRQPTTEVLIRSNYHVDAVEDGAAAWDVLQVKNYDLLVTDNNMCRLTGLGLVGKLQAARKGLPVILVSGAMPTEELNRHLWLQIDATPLKPFTVGELLGTMEYVLQANHNAREPMAPPPNS